MLGRQEDPLPGGHLPEVQHLRGVEERQMKKVSIMLGFCAVLCLCLAGYVYANGNPVAFLGWLMGSLVLIIFSVYFWG